MQADIAGLSTRSVYKGFTVGTYNAHRYAPSVHVGMHTYCRVSFRKKGSSPVEQVPTDSFLPHLPVGAVRRLDKWQVAPHFESPFRRDDVCARVLLQHHLHTAARCAVHMRSRSQAPHRAAPPEHCGTTLYRDPHECTQRPVAAGGCDGSAMRHIATAQCVLRAGTARSPSCIAQLGYKAPSARIRLHPFTRHHGLASTSVGERKHLIVQQICQTGSAGGLWQNNVGQACVVQELPSNRVRSACGADSKCFTARIAWHPPLEPRPRMPRNGKGAHGRESALAIGEIGNPVLFTVFL